MRSRYGIGEWYGSRFDLLTPNQIREFARAERHICPFKSSVPGKNASTPCHKKGGVCSLREFNVDSAGKGFCSGSPITTCPSRFLDEGTIFRWVGETLLNTSQPDIVTEIPFLMSEQNHGVPDTVGKIDCVLVHETDGRLDWCALEMQAVYFSGSSMANDFSVCRTWKGPGIPVPKVFRHPDYRSSGPKRLMPQLQTKVPTISRWGRKMAVVVDEAFWNSLGTIREVSHLSNAEIVWFVVRYEPHNDRFKLQPGAVHYTTLSFAVEGLTGGLPIALDVFESSIRERLVRGRARQDRAR